MKCDCVPATDDGEVTKLTWGNTTVHVNINACGVKNLSIWYASYTYDGLSRVLHLSQPTQVAPAPPARSLVRKQDLVDGKAMIERVEIECWGSSSVATPVDSLSATSGTATIIFDTPGPSTSGPVGGVNGP